MEIKDWVNVAAILNMISGIIQAKNKNLKDKNKHE